MKRITTLILFCCLWTLTAKAEVTNTMPSDLSVEVIDIQPPKGSILKVTEPVTVMFKYAYTSPNEPLNIWAWAGAKKGSYQPSTPSPSKMGIAKRWFTYNEPGHVKSIIMTAKNLRSEIVYEKEIETDYTFVPNPETEQLKDDGVGSRIVSVEFNPTSAAVLPVGGTVAVKVNYDINAAKGLYVWAVPMTDCVKTYAPSDEEKGKAQVVRGFRVGEPCQVKNVRVGMHNMAGQVVFEQIFDVDYTFVQNKVLPLAPKSIKSLGIRLRQLKGI